MMGWLKAVMRLFDRNGENNVKKGKSSQHKAIEADVLRSERERERLLEQQRLTRDAVHQLLKSQVIVITRDRYKDDTPYH